MGKPTASPPNSTPNSITHFSHPHPLHLSNPQIPHCSACKLAAAAAVYACITCNFALHPKCSQLPQKITHPFDKKHALTLYPKPVYPEGLFNCDACANRGAGFSYHCSPCGIDLHTTCASLPLKLTTHLHGDPLTLTFSAPYPGNSFSCDICKKLGQKTWLYRCAACEFDVHLTCVAAVVSPPAAQHTVARSFVPAQNYPMNLPNVGAYGGYGPRPAVAGQVAANGVYNYQGGIPAQAAYGNANIQPVYGGVRPGNGLRDQIVLSAVEGAASGVAQSATDALFQGFFGGGAGNAMCVDVMGMDSSTANIDGGYVATDGGYNGGDESYY